MKRSRFCASLPGLDDCDEWRTIECAEPLGVEYMASAYGDRSGSICNVSMAGKIELLATETIVGGPESSVLLAMVGVIS